MILNNCLIIINKIIPIKYEKLCFIKLIELAYCKSMTTGISKLFKKTLILLLVINLSFTSLIANTSTVISYNAASDTNEITFFTDFISVATNNISQVISTKLLVGLIVGGNTEYYLVTALNEQINFPVSLLLTRGVETDSIFLSFQKPIWEGTFSFGGCCENILQDLYIQLAYSPQSVNSSYNGTIFTICFSIYKYPLPGTPLNSQLSSGNNALGFPYPPRAFIVGLMILLIGMIPIGLVVQILKKFTRRKKI